jgi:hypothetical protein
MDKEQSIVIGIPGQWKNQEDIVKAIEAHSKGWNFSGMMLLNTETNESFGLEIYEKTEGLHLAFEQGSQGRIGSELLQKIEAHTFILYLIGPGGSIEHAKKIMQVANSLLAIGGLGIKVESAGKAFSAEQWAELCSIKDPAVIYDCFVTKLQAAEDVFYTCGMHNLGFRDGIVGNIALDQASQTLDQFSLYQIIENPTLDEGDAFVHTNQNQKYELYKQEDARYEDSDIFHNRYGLWILNPVQ